MPKQKKKKKKKAKKENATKIIPMTGEETDEEDIDEDDEEGGIYMEKEDVKIIFHALKEYKPTQKEKQRFELLVEEFEEMLVVDDKVKFPVSPPERAQFYTLILL
jgi:hypothetical protein